MDGTLHAIVQERLDATDAEGEWPYFVLAALEGASQLAALLGGAQSDMPRAARPARTRAAARDAAQPPPRVGGAYLRSITIEGFRGIGPRRTLDLAPGPGLTVVAGRNGSGKSSFAEGLEILLTGANWRWASRSKVWQQGWRNLHHTKVEVAAELAVEGEPGPTRLARTWPGGAELGASRDAVVLSSGAASTIAASGWADAAEMYRPLLSYNELGAMFEGKPTEFHDALAAILGLGALEAAAKLLKDARLDREHLAQDAKERLAKLLPRLAASMDRRAAAAHAAVKGRRWDLVAAEAALDGATEVGGVDELAILRDLAGLTPPSFDAVLQATDEARTAITAMARAAKTPAGDARRMANILREALDHHAAHGDGACPVCGRNAALSGPWRATAEQEIARLDEAAAEAEAAEELGRAAIGALAKVVSRPPDILSRAGSVDLDASTATAAWQAFADGPYGDLGALADHLDATIVGVEEAVAGLRLDAANELARREDLWKPLARDLAAWLPAGRDAQLALDQVTGLKHAETWLKETGGGIGSDRFRPLAESARRLWELLRTASSVELERVVLAGTGPQRHVTLDVTVDGVEGAALGVMSQGELHAMALSLFLPRATVVESPFRFVVIDDPVQSMDPSRVDGLARVLEEVGRTRQVVVFTHDDRLRDSVRRLGIDARVIEIHRREASVVDIRPANDPVTRNLDDADAIARTPELPANVARQTVPGFCRAAIEAACIEVIRRRRIGTGEAHVAVEQLIEDHPTLNQRMALAIWNDPSRGGEVGRRVSQWGEGVADAWGISNRGAHAGYGGDLRTLVSDARTLCRRIREIQA